MTAGRSLTGLVKPRECGEPTPGGRRCREQPYPVGYNPLGFCITHLVKYRDRIKDPTPINAAAPVLLLNYGGEGPMGDYR